MRKIVIVSLLATGLAGLATPALAKTTILCGNGFATPMMHFCFTTNLSSENDERIAMIAISGNDFRNCVAAGNQNRQEQRDCAPETNAATRPLILCNHRPVAGQINIQAP